ncbi:MAG: hypothetical protein CMP23_09280 [Rickettsiales bacterium]|nr:hypothetical protein [Rickettsiales bacterium]|tara:strand:- start:1987 stop:2517 length:531 start_codon:yes stop_codon:yes gene_type:complete
MSVRLQALMRASAAFLLFFLCACDPAVPAGEVSGDCRTEDLYKGEQQYFDEVMVPEVFEVYCTVCHGSDKIGAVERKGATEGLNYDDFEGSRAWNTTFPGFGTWHEMQVQTMPPMGRMPSTEELQLVLDWVNCELAARQADDDDDSAAGDDDDDSAAGDDDDDSAAEDDDDSALGP